ncbi:MAG: hypothetical protein ABIA47_03350 [bacterium]
MEAYLLAGLEPDPRYVLTTGQQVLYFIPIVLGTLMMVGGLIMNYLQSRHGRGLNILPSTRGEKAVVLIAGLAFMLWLGTGYLFPALPRIAFCLFSALPALAALIAIGFYVFGWFAFAYMWFGHIAFRRTARS